MSRALGKLVILAASGALLAGCAGIHDHKGQMLDNQLVSGIQPGVDNKDSVARTLGRPTFAGQFADNDWYYFSRDTRAFAFRKPQAQKQEVVHVQFDRAGNVAAIETTGKEKIAQVQLMHEKTPTLGRKKGFFDEVFGNVGVGAGGMGGPGGGASGGPGGGQ